MVVRFLIIVFTFFVPCGTNSKSINIEWVDNLQGDFSFINNWDYADHVYKNDKGQLVCDGLCPEESYLMKDAFGNIYQDSITRYYQLVDTTHVNYTIDSKSNAYEWLGSNQIVINQFENDTIKAYTLLSPATHSSLKFIIFDDECQPYIDLKSITPVENKSFECNGGFIKIQKDLLKIGMMKAEFYFTFDNALEPDKPLYWKGKIFSVINRPGY